MPVFEKTHALIEKEYDAPIGLPRFWVVAGPEVRALQEATAKRLPVGCLSEIKASFSPHRERTVSHWYGDAHLSYAGIELPGMELRFSFMHPLLGQPPECQIDLRLDVRKRKYLQALGRILDNAPETVGTLLSLSNVRVEVGRSPGENKPRWPKPLSELQHAVATERADTGRDYVDLDENTDGFRVVFPVRRSMEGGQCHVAIAVMSGIYAGMVMEDLEPKEGVRVIKGILDAYLDHGCRPGARGIDSNGVHRKAPPRGNEGFVTEDPIWFEFTPAGGEVTDAVIRCNESHTMLEYTTHRSAASSAYFIPTKASRAAALCAAKRYLSRFCGGKGDWKECSPRENFQFRQCYVDRHQEELYARLEPNPRKDEIAVSLPSPTMPDEIKVGLDRLRRR